MGFRDDREALEAKARAAEQELAATRAELADANERLDEVEREAEQLRATVRARGDDETRMNAWTAGLIVGLLLGAVGALLVLLVALEG